MKHAVLEVKFISETVFILTIERNGMEFIPGQYVVLGDSRFGREYSIFSPVTDRTLKFLIRVESDSVCPLYLSKLQPGNTLEVSMPYGDFILPKEPEKYDYVMIATGTGIAPIHCIAKSYPDIYFKIIHGLSYNKDIPADVLEFVSTNTRCISREKVDSYFSGRVTNYMEVYSFFKDQASTRFYLCGNSGMILDMTKLLESRGTKKDNITTEAFF